MRTPEYEPEASRRRPAPVRPDAEAVGGGILRWASAVGNASAGRVLGAPARAIQRQVDEEEVEEPVAEEQPAPEVEAGAEAAGEPLAEPEAAAEPETAAEAEAAAMPEADELPDELPE